MARAVAAGRARRRRPRGVPRSAGSSAPSSEVREQVARVGGARCRHAHRSASAWCRSTSRASTTSRCSGTRCTRVRARAVQARVVFVTVAAPAQDAAALAFGCAAPHAVLDAIERARTRGTRRAPGTPRTRAARSRHRCRRKGRTRPGSMPRHRAWNIHAYSSGVSSTVTSTSTNRTAVWFPGSHLAACPAVCTPKVHIVTSNYDVRAGQEGCVRSRFLAFRSANSQVREETLKTVEMSARMCTVSSEAIHGSTIVSDAGRTDGSRSAARRSDPAASPDRRAEARASVVPRTTRRRRVPAAARASESSRSSAALIGALVGGGDRRRHRRRVDDRGSTTTIVTRARDAGARGAPVDRARQAG